MVKPIKISGRLVGPGAPGFIIAEAGVNHNGSVEMARQLIDAAVEARADAIKFQTFTAEKLLVPSAPKASYQNETTDPAESQLAMIKRLELSLAAFEELNAYARARGIMFLSTPFDEESADFLQQLGMAAFKIPSGELTNTPLVAHIAALGKPMVISTGMADLNEVKTAVACARENGCDEIVLLQCVSNYPAAPADANLRAMETMSAEFGVPTGYSDHVDGTAVALAAVARGACVMEKHLTLDRSLPGPDHRASLEPQEFARFVRDLRNVEASIGTGHKQPAAAEATTAVAARRSVVAAREIFAGTALTQDLLALRRPGTGLPASMLDQLVGRTACVDIPDGAVLTMEMLA